VLKQLTAFLRDRGEVLNGVRSKRKSPNRVSAVLAHASTLAEVCEAGSFASQVEVVACLVQRITVAQDQVTIEIDRKGLAERLLDREASSASEAENRRPIMLEVPVRFRRRGVEAKLIILGPQQPASEPDPNLVKALSRAHKWFGRIVRGEVSGVGDIASSERLCRTYVTRVLCLAFLAPKLPRRSWRGGSRPS
jgi:site-specific DNA recombinase